ncbi:MAG TPA: FxsA family protein [Pseudonocardiaceae bacterium]
MVLLIGLAVLAVAEILVLVTVGGVIGALPTVALVLASSLLGLVLLRRQGTQALQGWQTVVHSGQVPSVHPLDGALRAAGALLVLLPGLVGDLLGLVCLLPPTRALLRTALVHRLRRHLTVVGPATRRGSERFVVVEGEVVTDVVTDADLARPGRILPSPTSGNTGFDHRDAP